LNTNIVRQISPRLAIVYLLAIPVLSLFIEFGWGITHGLLSGLSYGKDPTFIQAVTKFASERGIDLSQTHGDSGELMNRFSDKDRAELEKMTAEYLRKHNVVTLGSTLFSSALSFGLVAFVTGLLTRSWIFVGLIPLASFALNNPTTRYGIIADMTFSEKLLVVVLAQFGTSYLLAYLGAELRIGRTKEPPAISEE
jgi:hypothetical protein